MGFLRTGRAADAATLLDPIRKQAARDHRVHALFAQACAMLGRERDAITAFKRALSLKPDDQTTRLNFVIALQQAARHTEALGEIERLLYRSPGDRRFVRTKASILSDLGRGDEAAALVAGLLASPDRAGWPPDQQLAIAISAARLAPAHFDPADAISNLNEHAGDRRIHASVRIPAYQQLGRLHEAAGDYDAAFAAYASAKRVGMPDWDPDAHSAWVDQLITTWRNAPPVEPAPDAASGSRLVFILGMMRSGTSLTEQMLAQHPDITPGGERSTVARLVADAEPAPDGPRRFLPLPFSVDRYTPQACAQLGRSGLAAYNKLATDAGTLITDKQPYNFYFVPLLTRLFPGCRIIHCTRDPLDTCLSCFVQSFSRTHPHTHDLGWLGRYWRDYRRLIDAWAGLPGVELIELPYERLVTNAETEMRRVLAALGLSWDERVLEFHRSDRYVRTSSRDQVRKPLYTSSVGRAERFKAHLGPLTQALDGYNPSEPAKRG